MTSVKISWSNLPYERRLYVVYHNTIPPSAKCSEGDCLILPDRWGGTPANGVMHLLTETARIAWQYAGLGVAVEELPKLDDGDVVLYDKRRGCLEVFYQVRSTTNSLYVTNACNSRCQFCPQPSTSDDGGLYVEASHILDLVSDPCGTINITGGEPTIDKQRFLGLLSKMSVRWPESKAFVLTNGRNFADGSFVTEVMRSRGELSIGFGIPLYADCAVVHDSVVGVNGAFGQTIRGLYNLAVHKAEIEIRVVVSQLTYRRLPELIEFIGRNIPFVARVAVMGLEPMGYCRAHWEDFWIDPEDCGAVLLRAQKNADCYGINMLLYNFQLCCIPTSLRDVVCSTISEWKRVYHPVCLRCEMKSACGGFFSSQNADRYLPRFIVDKK